MSYLRVVESRIVEAMAAGAFDDLEGAGKPLDLRRGELAGDLWLGHHLLENGGALPAWLQLGADIERGLDRLRELDARHAALVGEAALSGASGDLLSSVDRVRREFEALARAVREMQDQFNLDAPGRLSERPGIWVEYHLQRLDERLRAAGHDDGASR